MSRRNQMLCAWTGPVAMAMWLVGLGLMAHFVPPPSPAWSAEHVAHVYQSRTDWIRAGGVVAMFGAGFIGPFIAVVSVQMKRIEGRSAPMAYSQLGLGVLLSLLFIMPIALLETAALRPHRDPALIQLLDDAAWLPFVGGFFTAFVQNIWVGICILHAPDERVFPRWVGWFSIWVSLTFVPDVLIYWYKTGPFSWRGVFPFWLIVGTFCSWFVVMFWAVRRAIIGEAEEEREALAAERREPVAAG